MTQSVPKLSERRLVGLAPREDCVVEVGLCGANAHGHPDAVETRSRSTDLHLR
jgi:hypothetical protein